MKIYFDNIRDQTPIPILLDNRSNLMNLNLIAYQSKIEIYIKIQLIIYEKHSKSRLYKYAHYMTYIIYYICDL